MNRVLRALGPDTDVDLNPGFTPYSGIIGGKWPFHSERPLPRL